MLFRSLSKPDFVLLEEIWEEISQLGFTLEVFGKSAILVSGVPPDVKLGSEKDLIEGLLDQYKFHKNTLRVPKSEAVARALATRTAKAAVRSLHPTEQESLVGRLFACKVPSVAPDARPTTLMLTEENILEYFKKG